MYAASLFLISPLTGRGEHCGVSDPRLYGVSLFSGLCDGIQVLGELAGYILGLFGDRLALMVLN